MRQLSLALFLITFGIVLIVRYQRAVRAQQESQPPVKPHLRNAGVGLILFGLYWVVGYVLDIMDYYAAQD